MRTSRERKKVLSSLSEQAFYLFFIMLACMRGCWHLSEINEKTVNPIIQEAMKEKK